MNKNINEWDSFDNEEDLRGKKIVYDKIFFKKIWGKLLNVYVNKENIIKFYDRLLKEIYKPLGLYREGDRYYVSGVYNTGYKNDSPRSNVNFLNTNYTAFRYFINKLNDNILEDKYNNVSQLDFISGDTHEEIKKLFDILSIYRDEIFNKNSEILLECIRIINITKKFGEEAEDYTIKRLSIFTGMENIIKSKDWGLKQDMLNGVDIKFTYKNKLYTIQVKSFNSIKLEDDIFIIKGISYPKKYNVDLLAFYNRRNDSFYMFKNKDVEINEDSMLIYKKYRKNI